MTHLSVNAAIFAALLGAHSVEAILSNRSSGAFVKEMMYTQNSLCRQNYCTNPIVPGINDLPRLEALTWQCSTASATRDYMDFCKEAVIYDPALPSPKDKAKAVADLVKAQEDAAMTMFVYHLNGMGYDAWDHRNPSESDSDCVRSVWKMVCYTYFPRAEAGCKAGEVSQYKRPCKSSCHNYIHQCGVECCDESVQCVFAHTSTSATGKVQLLQTGYVDEMGPSAMCTGGAGRSMSSPLLLLLGIFGLHLFTGSSQSQEAQAAKSQRRFGGFSRCFTLCLVAFLALSLQGCDVAIPRHAVGNWRQKANYLNEFKFVPTGKTAKDGVLNSCNQANVTAKEQCGGRGYCKSFSTSSVAIQASGGKPLAFCQCERDWADPECGTKRKSQRVAFFLSLFGGYLGADYFYLGYPLWGVGKLVTLGGCGFWYLIDVVRTGTGPVYARDFRTANDLPHWVAVMLMVFLCMTCGFVSAIGGYLTYRKKKRADILLDSNNEEAQPWKKTERELKNIAGPNFQLRSRFGPGSGGANVGDNYVGRPGFSGYGATMPLPMFNQSVSYATGTDIKNAVGPFGPAGIPGTGSPTPAAIPGAVAPTNIAGLDKDPAMMPQTDPVYYPPNQQNVVIENNQSGQEEVEQF